MGVVETIWAVGLAIVGCLVAIVIAVVTGLFYLADIRASTRETNVLVKEARQDIKDLGQDIKDLKQDNREIRQLLQQIYGVVSRLLGYAEASPPKRVNER